jgi:beta-lactamase class A
MSDKKSRFIDKHYKIIIYSQWVMFVLLFLTICFTGKYVYSEIDHIKTNPYPLIDPARQFISQDNYLINIQPLRDYFNQLQKTVGTDNITIYYEQLNSGANISVNKNLRLFPASLPKLPLAIVVARKVEKGDWKWDTQFTADPSDISSDSGSLYKTLGNNPITVEKLLEVLLIDSDNTAQNIFLKHVSGADLDGFRSEVGLEDLFDAQGYVSAKEYSRVLRVLYTSSFLERIDSEKILTLLSQSNFHDFLSTGIPDGVTFAHKYGENKLFHVFADSGIVYVTNQPYMLVVMLKGKDSSDESRQWAVNLMKEISQKAYEMSRKQ